MWPADVLKLQGSDNWMWFQRIRRWREAQAARERHEMTKAKVNRGR